jgi:predicted nucleic acid-binding protein
VLNNNCREQQIEEEKLTFYDAAYLSSIKTVEATLVTAHKIFHNQLSKENNAFTLLPREYA